MIEYHKTLPFSNNTFYWFLILSVLIIFSLKLVFKSKEIYLFILFAFSLSYLIFLFPKPYHFIGLTFYGFALFKLLGQKLKITGLKAIILYITPLVLMKIFNIIPNYTGSGEMLKEIVQIAGLSYAVFKMIQVHIDEVDTKNVTFLNYFSFIAFPPTLLIGPIDRFDRFRKNIANGFSNINSDNFIKGLNYLIKGLLYKYILAYAIYNLIIIHLDSLSGITYHLSYMYSYLFYLFFDFAGYSLLAIGIGYIIGIQVPINFNKPFLAQNAKEFWYRWHKTLGDWLNDYFFKPIFKDLTTRKKFRTSINRQSIALFATFTLMGFWNGFELHYIVSGALFGLYSVIYNYYNYLCKKNGKDVLFGNLNLKLVKYISIFIVFNTVAFSIYIFSGKLF